MIVKTIGGQKRRVYVCFDFERDRLLRDFFVDQGHRTDATWRVIDSSERYDQLGHYWLRAAASRIKQCELLVVMLGSVAFRSPGVLKEIQIAEIMGKKTLQIIPYGVGQPHIIPDVGQVVRWNWENVKRAMTAAPPPVLRYSNAFSV